MFGEGYDFVGRALDKTRASLTYPRRLSGRLGVRDIATRAKKTCLYLARCESHRRDLFGDLGVCLSAQPNWSTRRCCVGDRVGRRWLRGHADSVIRFYSTTTEDLCCRKARAGDGPVLCELTT